MAGQRESGGALGFQGGLLAGFIRRGKVLLVTPPPATDAMWRRRGAVTRHESLHSPLPVDAERIRASAWQSTAPGGGRQRWHGDMVNGGVSVSSMPGSG
jgi:hypothetical protein